MKKKSIFQKLILGGFIIFLISFIMVGTFMFALVMNTTVGEKKMLLKNSAERIGEIGLVTIKSDFPSAKFIFNSVVENISINIGASIVTFDNNKKILTASGIYKKQFESNELKKDKNIENVLKGEEVSKVGFGDKKGDTFLTYGMPIEENGIVRGGVLLSVSMPEINKSLKSILGNFLISALASLLIAFLLFYFIARRIVRPINEMSDAVKEFAKGKFDRRVSSNVEGELGELAENINNMAMSLENLENMRSSFISNVSHELRTPMTSITGFVEGVLDGTIPDDKKEEYLNIVLSESKRLSRLVTDLLNLSRIDSNNLKVNKRVFNINELIRLVIIKFESQITEKNIDLTFETYDDLCDVYADNDSITQVVTNILHNAIKFTDVGGSIGIRIWEYGDKVYVEIKNTGIGMTEEHLKYIWDRFYKADESRSMDTTGTGLGLFIVKNIINSHNEKIWAESLYGEFAKFTFSLSKRV